MTTGPYDRSAPRFWVRLLSDAGEHRLFLGDRLLSFEYEDTEKGADKCRLSISNRDLSNFDDPIWKKGNRLVVSWGYPGRMAVPREVVITKVSGSLTLAVEAKSLAELMNKRRKARTFENVTRAEVVRQVAAEYGFGESAQVVEDTVVRYPAIHQAGLTDAQFVMRLARIEGFQFYVDSAGLHFHKRNFAAAPARVFHYYTDPGMGEVVSFDVENDLTAKPGRVRRRARDPLAKEDVEGDSAAQAPSESVLTPVQEVAMTTDGAEPQWSTQPEPVPGEPEIVIDPETRAPMLRERDTEVEDTGPTSDAGAAVREASGIARRAIQVAVKMKLSTIGDPMLLAKTIVELRGFGKRLSVRYYIRSVKHTVGAGSYKMEASLVSDGSGGHDTTSKVVSGLELLDGGRRQVGNQNEQPLPPGVTPEEIAAGMSLDQPLTAQMSIDQETGAAVVSYVDASGAPAATQSIDESGAAGSGF